MGRTVRLSNGVEMPQIGYGVFQVGADETERCVRDAIEVGYRMIDTAQAYNNEEGVGRAVRNCGVNRDEIFVVSKIWISNYGEEKAAKSIDESLKKMGLEVIDLMLLHQPFCDRYGAYRALEKAYKAGKVRAIGVSNFYPDHFVDLAENVEVKPMVNQVETHVFNQQREAQRIMAEYGCEMMAWGPLAEGKNDFFNNPVLKQIGERHGRSVAQIALRFLLERGIIIIPKSSRRERMAENRNIENFALTAAETAAIEALHTGESVFMGHHAAETVKLFMTWR